MIIAQSTIRNTLLYSMKAEDYLLLQPSFVRVALPLRCPLYAAEGVIDQVYFPEDGVVSIVANG